MTWRLGCRSWSFGFPVLFAQGFSLCVHCGEDNSLRMAGPCPRELKDLKSGTVASAVFTCCESNMKTVLVGGGVFYRLEVKTFFLFSKYLVYFFHELSYLTYFFHKLRVYAFPLGWKNFFFFKGVKILEGKLTFFCFLKRPDCFSTFIASQQGLAMVTICLARETHLHRFCSQIPCHTVRHCLDYPCKPLLEVGFSISIQIKWTVRPSPDKKQTCHYALRAKPAS